MQADPQVHVAVCEITFETDCTLEIVESRCVLFSVHVYKTQIKRCDPLERVEIESALQTGNSGDVFLFSKETHPYVVP